LGLAGSFVMRLPEVSAGWTKAERPERLYSRHGHTIPNEKQPVI